MELIILLLSVVFIFFVFYVMRKLNRLEDDILILQSELDYFEDVVNTMRQNN
jgi:hypothetical protein